MADMPDNLSILDLENTLKCPVCFELRDGYIFVCQRGHHLCSVCSRSLMNCPTCQCAITACRNFVIESLISKYGFLILKSEQSNNNNATAQPSNSAENTTTAVSKITTASTSNTSDGEGSDSSGMPDSLKVLVINNTQLKPLEMSSGIFPCDLAFCKVNKVNLGVGVMIPHLRKTHGNILHYVYNTYGTVDFTSPLFLYKQSRKYHQAYHISNMGVFFFYIVILNDGYINMWITTAAPTSVAFRFQYEISLFVKMNSEYCTSFVGQDASGINPRWLKMGAHPISTQNIPKLEKVHPCGTEKAWLLERNEIMVVPPTQHLLSRDEPFNMDVTIVYH